MTNKVAESTHIIRFMDCDPFNHLNNSKFIDYFLNAREDHLREVYGFDIYNYALETGLGWVVAKNEIVYLKPAVMSEKVKIQTTILEWNKDDILLEARMWNEAKTHLKSLLWTRFVHFNLKTQRRIEHNDFLNNHFNTLENALDRKVNFEERLGDLQEEIAKSQRIEASSDTVMQDS